MSASSAQAERPSAGQTDTSIINIDELVADEAYSLLDDHTFQWWEFILQRVYELDRVRPNILLVILDGVRAKNCSLSGHERRTTPHLETLSDRATTYEFAYAPSNWSLPSHTSLFTGYHVPEHGVTVQFDVLKPGHTIWETVRDTYDYDTALFSQNEFISSDQYGLSAGFETVVGRVSTRKYPFQDAVPPDIGPSGPTFGDFLKAAAHDRTPLRTGVNYLTYALENLGYRLKQTYSSVSSVPVRPRYRSPAAVHTERFLQWHARRDGPWAACLNFMDANTMHFPWPDLGPWADRYQEMIIREINNLRWDFHSGRQPWWKLTAMELGYDDGIRTVDAALGRILDVLNDRDALNDTLVVVTSDHGDALGVHSRVRPRLRLAAHSAGIHERLLHIPLVVRVPGQQRATTVSEPVSLTHFPDVVRKALNDDITPGAFSSDGPVVAAAEHDRLYEYVRKHEEWGIGEYLDEVDLSKFSGRARAVYRETEDGVRKYADWGDDVATVQVDDAQHNTRVGTAGTDELDDAFESLTDQDVRESPHDVDDLDEETLSRLRKLGYT